MPNKILAVIPVLNLWKEYTIHCLESVVASIGETEYHVALIDNASTDETYEHAQDFANRKLPGRMAVKHNDQNKGCAGGWNDGVAYGMENGFTHFLILNNDTLIGPHTLQRLYDRMAKGGAALASAVDVTRELVIPNDVLDPGNAVNAKPDTEAPHPNFSCFMIDRATVETVGYFDEEYFPAYYEDNDYHYRIKLAGLEAIATTTATFIHYGSRTQNQLAGSPIVPGERFRANEAFFARKWGGPPGRETYTTPFNDPSKKITDVKRTI